MSYDFFDDSKVLPTADILKLVRTIIKFNQELTISCNNSERAKTLQAITDEQAKCKRWLRKKGVHTYDPKPFIISKKGSDFFMSLLREYLETEYLQELDDVFSTAYVNNPLSGERIKGHAIVLAELGLVDYHGKIVRDPTLFTGQWSKSHRAEHIIKRLAFVRELWALSGLSPAPLYRAYGHDAALTNHRPSFLSTTFSLKVADDIFKSTTGHVAVLFRQEVPLERLFMTFLETPAMNRQHCEAEAIVLTDRNNLAF